VYVDGSRTSLSPIILTIGYITTQVLLFEGSITLCLPLQEALQERDAPQFSRVYQQTITGIVLFYCVFGITCWTAFGDTVDTVLTTSLPPGVLATTVQLAYSVAVIFTFPLQIFPALEILVQAVTPHILKRQEHNADQELSRSQRTMVVSVVITVLSIIAVVEMNNLGRVVSLMGALLGCPLAFVFPPLIHNQIVLGNSNGWRKNCNHVVAGIGVLAMVGATLTTLATWKDGGEGRR
jgi:proton-coupled amino acid transporter